jgi:hypothetical protein
VDLVRWLSGAEVTRARAAVAASNSALELELSEGRGLARVKCAANRPYRERVLAGDGNGRRLGRYSVTGLKFLVKGSSAEHPLVQSIVLQLEAFGRAVRGDLEPILASAHDGVAVMATLGAARASAARGSAWESVQERLSGR